MPPSRSSVIIWVVYEMAVRREMLPALREELSNILEVDCDSGEPTLTYASLRNAELLDSFIREVFRMKGDTLSIVRLTTKDVSLGSSVIPKGSFVIPMATLSHENVENWGDDAKSLLVIAGLELTKLQRASAHPTGRLELENLLVLAASSQLLLMVLSLISRVDIFMEGGEYEVIDPMNTVAVPPRGQLLLPLAKPLL
ncbi:hypothetical protein H0H87_011854 [Tephrocybe sp. NHM501043]|nr:hypothetical protein H0H87_011854 [Tephrocybe sp. NHM501043]